MKARELITEIQQVCERRGIQCPDARTLLTEMSSELRSIAGKADWEWAAYSVDPAIITVDGQDTYYLPANFPDNFSRWSGGGGDQYACALDDGSAKRHLEYMAAVAFFSVKMNEVSEGVPSAYTVVTAPDGRKQIRLFPTPDDDYEVSGVYQPTDIALEEMSDLPPMAHTQVLKYGVLRRLDPSFETDYREALADLLYRAAINRTAQMVPLVSDYRMR